MKAKEKEDKLFQEPNSNGGMVKLRIAWNRGKRKPITDENGELWCDCKFPRLTTAIGRGQAFCLLCKTAWYH